MDSDTGDNVNLGVHCLPNTYLVLILKLYMPGTTRTKDFQDCVAEKRNALPDVKRRKISRPARGDGAEREGQNLLGKEFVAEAYVIVRTARILLHASSEA